jgi:hypothetical protein
VSDDEWDDVSDDEWDDVSEKGVLGEAWDDVSAKPRVRAWAEVWDQARAQTWAQRLAEPRAQGSLGGNDLGETIGRPPSPTQRRSHEYRDQRVLDGWKMPCQCMLRRRSKTTTKRRLSW